LPRDVRGIQPRPACAPRAPRPSLHLAGQRPLHEVGDRAGRPGDARAAVMPRPARATWIVAGVALALRLLYVAQGSHTPYYEPRWLDPLFYWTWAGEIAAGNWLGGRIFFQSPLYAYVLAVFRVAFGDRIFPILIAQAVLGAATCVLTLRIARRVLGEREAFVA